LLRPCTLALACAVVLSFLTHPAIAAPPCKEPSLVTLAAAKFPNLTRAERALLEFADKSNINRGEFAIAGTSPAPLDPSNDPAHASEWSHDRDIRAGLIRWLAVDNDASVRVDPNGVRVMGARIAGPIDLAHIRVPFAIALVRCSISDSMNLESTELPYLDLSGSHTGSIQAADLIVHGNLDLGEYSRAHGEFRASGLVYLAYAKIGGWANFGGGHFHYSEHPQAWERNLKPALFLSGAEVNGDVNLCCGFQSQGCAFMAENRIGGDLNCYGGQFVNPGNAALEAGGNDIKGVVFLGPNPGFFSGAFDADGLVMFENTRVEAFFLVDRARFGGKASEPHGLFAEGLSVRGVFIWHDATLENGALLDLSNANISAVFDDEKSWPPPGKLLIDGFTYHSLGGTSSYFTRWTSPTDAGSRLRWLALQPGFHPQPYRQLAKVLAESGDDAGATRVRIAAEDLRYAQHGTLGRLWGAFLKYTIGYGHRPLLAIEWSFLVVLLGWIVVRVARDAGVMRLTWPENTVPPIDPHAGLYPLLYSLDVFVPFVNLHQEHYWWPDPQSAGEAHILGTPLRVRGSLILYYLWFQIIAGWLLSAIFVAGVTGLIRGD
jgi:hypothetical protein